MDKVLEFTCDFVEADETIYTEDYTVVGIYFGEGDPEVGGQHWNFTQSIGNDEDEGEGVCTVKEIQQVVCYGGIASFEMNRNRIVVKFNEFGSRQTKTNELIIHYSVDDECWRKISTTATRVFKDASYFTIT